MRLCITIFMLAVFSNICLGQEKLFLKKGLKSVRLKNNATIGLRTINDSFTYRTSSWKISGITKDSLTIKKPDQFEYQKISNEQVYKFLDSGWEMDSVIEGQVRSFIMKRPVSYLSVGIPYKHILEIQYAKSENTSGCIGCVMFPLLVILSPIISWEKGKFQTGPFLFVFSTGMVGSLLVYSSFKKRDIKKYRVGDWKIRVKG